MPPLSTRRLRTLLLLGVLLSALPVAAADARTRSLVWNTLLLAGATCGISLPLGTVLAWLLVRTDLPGRRFGLGVLAVLLFVPLYLQAAAWEAGFGVQGCFTRLVGGPPLLDGWRGAIWIHAAAAVPWVVLIVGAGLWLIEPELEEQALLDGSPRQVLWHVTLRGALPALGVAALWAAITTASEITVTDLFVVRTYAEELYTQQVAPQPDDVPLGMWLGVAVTAWLVLAGLLLCAQLAPRDRPITLRARLVYRLGRWRLPMTAAVAAALLLLAGVPLGNLAYKAGISVHVAQAESVRTWSPWRCLAVVAASPVDNWREFRWSLGIGLLAATGAVAAAVALAWPARRGGHRAMPALLLSAICLAMPKPLVGLGIIELLNRPGIGALTWLYDQSILAPWLAQFTVALPPVVLILWHALRTIPSEVLDAAAVDGAGPLGQLWRIALPGRLPALALAWVVAMAVALGELGASILVVPPGVVTLPIKIFNLLHGGVSEFEVSGICLALVAVFAAAAMCIVWLARSWRQEETAM
jgi:iron(III) transport system permease protein